MQTSYLKTLLFAAETGNFSRTAEILNMTQSAVSQRIKFLEELFGHQLFDRSSTGLILTPAGSKVISTARNILSLEQELINELQRCTGGSCLTLGCTPTYGISYLPRVLNRFLLKTANLDDFKFNFVQPEQAVKGVNEGIFDLAIVEHCQDLDLGELFYMELADDELIFISSPQLELGGGAVQLDDFLRHRLYTRRDGYSSKQLLVENLEAAGRSLDEFHGVIISDDLRLNIESVAAGNGISFISRCLVLDQLAVGTLRAHHVPEFRQVRSRSVILQPHRTVGPLLQALLECIEAECHTFSCHLTPSPTSTA
jgi:DNA-binding transcriptional LysR family regulator